MLPPEPTLRLIVVYKLFRAAGSIVGAAALAILLLSGERLVLETFLDGLRSHLSSALALQIAQLLLSALEPGHVWVLVAALTLDGALVFLEGLSLWRGWRFGPWLVVGASAVLLPFELRALWERVTLGRALILVLNLAIALYLVVRARRRTRTTAR